MKFDIGNDPVTGERRTRVQTVKGTRRQALSELTRLLALVDRNAYVDPTSLTLKDFIEQWVRDWAEHNLSPKTRERYDELIALNIVPHLGAEHVQKLRPIHLAELYSKLLREGRVNGGGLSGRSVSAVHKILHRVLGHALQWDIVSQNVAAVVDPPKVVAKEIQIVSADEVATVLRKLKGVAIYPIALTALSTGARRGELLALRWRDVDFDRAMMRIERSLEQTKGGKKLRFKEPKTRHGRRNISLPSSLVTELRSHWKEQQELRLSLGMGGAAPNDLVFCKPEGEPMIPNSVSTEWRRNVRVLKLPKVSFHALRHTHVSQLIDAGMDVLTISRRIGHASPVITLGIYGHLFKNNDAQAATVIENAFGNIASTE